jgi:hypothetical protein
MEERTRSYSHVLEYKKTVIGVYCPCCGVSYANPHEPDLFHVLEKLLEDRDPSFVTEDHIRAAKRRVELLRDEVVRRQAVLVAAEEELRELEAKPRLKEGSSYRVLPPSSESAKIN